MSSPKDLAEQYMKAQIEAELQATARRNEQLRALRESARQDDGDAGLMEAAHMWSMTGRGIHPRLLLRRGS